MKDVGFLEKIALFYYFSFLDEAKAQAITARTLKVLHKQPADAEIVSTTNHFLQETNKRIKPVGLAFSAGSIVLPEKSNWGPWFEFRKQADPKDFHTLLYAKILGIADNDIATGLNVPVGSVRYRLGRGLKQLGQILQQATK